MRGTHGGRVAACLAVVVAALGVLALSGCEEAGRLRAIAPHLLAPGAQGGAGISLPLAPPPVPRELPPEQTSAAFEFTPAGTDAEGRLLYRVRIGPGGSPALVALRKFTPLFAVDGQDALSYVSHAYFQQYPQRTARSIQPGDEFLLALPPDTFVVRWQEERQEQFGHPARLREYVSERGDRLRYYLTAPFPLRYELEPAGTPGRGVVHFAPDLAYLLRTGRTDPLRLAQLVYRVPDPDILQVETMRQLAAAVQPGEAPTLEVDRRVPYRDPVRVALPQAAYSEAVSEEPERAHWRRAVFSADSGQPFMAVEDALGARPDLAGLPAGQPFRIEYQWDGTVRVLYLTGPNDALGKRDPYHLRENARWAALYARLAPDANTPVKWGPGEPSDLAPFPTARDSLQRDPSAYDYLVPGRVLVLTFRPTRFLADLQAETEFRELLGEMRTRYREEIDLVLRALDFLQSWRAALRAGRPAHATGQAPQAAE
ncbi:MAG TPA: hypothetical protein VKZ60_11120 [Chloroflexota bacterium]|jgi:hypothetical protein|nr:hypothetical protein [Chloroflexota bacterium]